MMTEWLTMHGIDLTLRPYLILLGETLITVAFFYQSIRERSRITVLRAAILTAALLSLLYLYAVPHIFINFADFNFWLRFVYRAAAYCLIVYALFAIEWRRTVYLSVFISSIHIASQNVFATPFLRDLVRIHMTSFWGISGEIWGCITELAFRAFTLLIICACVRLRHIEHPTTTQYVVLLFTVICELYVKQTLHFLAEEGRDGEPVLTSFTLLIQVLQICFLIYFERYVDNQNIQKELQFQDITNQYRLQSSERYKQQDEATRAMNHDLKHHLRAIRQLSTSAQNDQICNYVSAMLQEVEQSEVLVQTGNSLLDGLIADKINQGKQNHIEIEVVLDFSKITFLDDYTLCTVFGNLMDNALEACLQVPEDKPRRIRVRSDILAEQLHIAVINTCNGSVHLLNGLPTTIKSDSTQHGFGLRNVRRVLKRYDGILALDVSIPDRFACMIQIPMPETAD